MPAPSSISDYCLRQGRWCRRLGSAFYGYLLTRCAIVCEQDGPIRDLVQSRQDDDQLTSLPVRMLAAVHKLVLQGKAPELARFYPSVGGTVDFEPAWAAFNQTVREHLDSLTKLIERPVQMNDIERSAGLLGGFGLIAGRTRLPLCLLEVGTSGGLNLRWDRYHYQWRGGGWGEAESRVRFTNIFSGEYPSLPARIEISERAGCDPNPIDVSSPDGRLTLLSYVFPDERERVEQLKAAIDIAREVPCDIHEASGADWLGSRLESPGEGSATVVFHSIVWQYLSKLEQQRITTVIEEAGKRASKKAPLAWLRMEPGLDRPADEGWEVRLRLYPGSGEQLIAVFRHLFHVPSVEWLLKEPLRQS